MRPTFTIVLAAAAFAAAPALVSAAQAHGSPTSATNSTESSTERGSSTAASAPASTSATGTLHDRIEHAGDLAKRLLELRQAGTSRPSQPDALVPVDRSQLKNLQDEVAAIKKAEPASGATLQMHLTRARALASSLLEEAGADNAVGTSGAASAAQRHAKGGVVTIDRTRLKELSDALDAIEEVASNRS